MTEIHWADHIAEEIKKRIENVPEVADISKEEIIVYDEKTPSGSIHIGSGRSWIMHDCIAKALRKLGLNARFILSSDDLDPYDKPNKGLDESWNKYLGMPFRNIPSPVEGHDNYGDFFFFQATQRFEELGIEADLESTGEKYESGAFNEQIKIILDNYKKVQEIFRSIYGEDNASAKKIPFNVICEKCGKVVTTVATEWDGGKLAYECKKGNFKWADGCGHKGRISPYNGNGKFPWKVEWAAKWPMRKVVCEYAGKDHFTKNGSRTVAVRIANEVLNFHPPFPSTRTKEGKGHEFFNVGGKKMSTSKGMGFPFYKITQMLPPKIVRFLLLRSRPNSVIDFDPSKDNDIILLFERYDEAQRKYYSEGDRTFELSQTGDIPVRLPVQIQFTLAAALVQTQPGKEIETLKKMGHLDENVEEIDLHQINERMNDAKQWIKHFASEKYKYNINTDVPDIQLSEKQKKSLRDAAQAIRKDIDSKEIGLEFKRIISENDIETKEFFSAAYNVIINRDRGPLLSSFILTIGKERVIKLFEKV